MNTSDLISSNRMFEKKKLKITIFITIVWKHNSETYIHVQYINNVSNTINIIIKKKKEINNKNVIIYLMKFQ